MRQVRSRAAISYEWVVGIAGLLAGSLYIGQITQHNPLVTLFIFGLAVVLEAKPVPLGKVVSSLLIALPIGVMVVYGAGEAICLMIVAELLSPLISRMQTRLSTQFFNAGQYAMSALAMARTYEWIAGPRLHPQLNWMVFCGILVSVAVFVVTNHIFIHGLTLLRGAFEASDLLSVAVSDGIIVLIALPFAFLMIALSPHNPLLAPIAMFPIAVLGQMLRLQRRSAFLQRVYAITAQLTSEFDLERICENVAAVTKDLAYADAVAVFIMNDDQSALVPQVFSPSDNHERLGPGGLSEVEQGILMKTVRETGWLYIPDTRKYPDFRDTAVETPYLSLAVFPFQSHKGPYGAIVCYAARPFAFGELTGSISVLASQLAVLVENAKLYGQLQEQSWRDGATNLYNYRFFYEALEREVAFAAEHRQPLSVAILDVDFFKNFNDTYGHLAGDAVLKSVGELLIKSFGPEVTVARYGGEEFSVLVRAGLEETRVMVESVRQQIGMMSVDYDGYKLQGISVSAGVASYPEHADNDRELLLKADSAMYWGAKQRGRNRTALYTPEFEQQLFVDSLTGLYTHHFVNIRTREEFTRGVQLWGVICIDLARFAEVNASYGFDEGDAVLREVSLRLRESLRQSELACRFGGDEFLILVPRVSQAEAELIADRITKAVASTVVPISGKVVSPIRCRTSVSVYSDLADSVDLFTRVGTQFTNLQREADQALA